MNNHGELSHLVRRHSRVPSLDASFGLVTTLWKFLDITKAILPGIYRPRWKVENAIILSV
jgi:hypothetical protein